MVFRALLVGVLLIAVQYVEAQNDSIGNSQWNLKGNVWLRSMQTVNSGDLADFHVTVVGGDLGLGYRATPWLKFSGSVYGLTHFGLSGIKKIDKVTLNGPMYESNLWNLIWFENDAHFALPELNAEVDLGNHRLTLGRFLFKSPFFNPEIWPFKNAAEGIRYVFERPKRKLRIESELVHRISTRFDARYRTVGDSFGRGGIGVGFDGKRSRYTGNVNSYYMASLGVDWGIIPGMKLTIWNQYVDNVVNNLLIEPKWSWINGWSASAMFIQQFKVNDGGNSDQELTYLRDERAAYFGFRIAKHSGRNLFQLNFSRILDQGRLQLTRDWAIEPFYTLQRRNRIEGTRDATVVMMKWQQQWKNSQGDFRWVSSVSHSWMPFPGNGEMNKYRVPSNAQIDFAFKYAPASFVKGISLELFVAYRFLAEDIGTDNRYLINRADFFHSDWVISYNF